MFTFELNNFCINSVNIVFTKLLLRLYNFYIDTNISKNLEFTNVNS